MRGTSDFGATSRWRGPAHIPVLRLRAARPAENRPSDKLAQERAAATEVRPPQLAASFVIGGVSSRFSVDFPNQFPAIPGLGYELRRQFLHGAPERLAGRPGALLGICL